MFPPRVDAEAGAAPDQYWKFGLVLDPSVPAAVPPVGEKLLKLVVPERLNVKPVEAAVVAGRLTVVVLWLADTALLPVAPELQSHVDEMPPVAPFVIALDRFVATVVFVSPDELVARTLQFDPEGVLRLELALNVYLMLPIVTDEPLDGRVVPTVSVAVAFVGVLAVTVTLDAFVIVMVSPALTRLELTVVL